MNFEKASKWYFNLKFMKYSEKVGKIYRVKHELFEKREYYKSKMTPHKRESFLLIAQHYLILKFYNRDFNVGLNSVTEIVKPDTVRTFRTPERKTRAFSIIECSTSSTLVYASIKRSAKFMRSATPETRGWRREKKKIEGGRRGRKSFIDFRISNRFEEKLR